MHMASTYKMNIRDSRKHFRAEISKYKIHEL